MERAVIFFEPNGDLQNGVQPLALETIQGKPVLYWMARALSAQGATRFFLAAPPRLWESLRVCAPHGAEFQVSDRHDSLMAFLSTPETVAVFPRAALPIPQAGAGGAYAASGDALRQTWSVRMTNAVQDAELLSGWVPLYGRETLDELKPHFQPDKLP